MNAPSSADIRDRAARAIFGKPMIENIYRGLVSEQIVGAALGPTWEWFGNWNAYDFAHVSGVFLEVKQSARLQTWTVGRKIKPRPVFDIYVRPGHFVGDSAYIPNPDRIRLAQIYVFALHAITDATVDHADPLQWSFYVVAGDRLPTGQKTITLSRVASLTQPVRWEELASTVESMRVALPAHAPPPSPPLPKPSTDLMLPFLA
jgi:hypothetical protein